VPGRASISPGDLRAIIDAERADVPLKDLKHQQDGSRVMSRDALNVQPWRSEAGEGKGLP
jgi:hypothetical protein